VVAEASVRGEPGFLLLSYISKLEGGPEPLSMKLRDHASKHRDDPAARRLQGEGLRTSPTLR